MASRASRALSALAAMSLVLLAGPAKAGGLPSGPIAMAVVDHVGDALQVTETVSQPGSGRYALWPGAYNVSVPAGACSCMSGMPGRFCPKTTM